MSLPRAPCIALLVRLIGERQSGPHGRATCSSTTYTLACDAITRAERTVAALFLSVLAAETD